MVATFKMSVHEQAALRDAYESLARMPGIWRSVAASTALAARGSTETHQSYAEGLASGQQISAGQLDELVAALLAALPKCAHGKRMTEFCNDCLVGR